MARQKRLTNFTAWVEGLPGIGSSGYIDAVDDVAAGSTTLLWNQSSTLERRVKAEAKQRGIALSFRSWPYSRDQIDEGISATWTEIGTDPAWSGFEVGDIVGLDPDQPGITVEGSFKPDVDRVAVVGDSGPTLDDLGKKATAAAGIKVVVEDGVQVTTAAATRSNDSSPFNAAGYMISASAGKVCTTGFAVHYQGATHTTTAQHCTYSDYKARDGSATYGYSKVTDPDDGARLLGGHGSPLNFDGAYNDSDGYKKTVLKLDTTINIGDFVYTSGGNSGVHGNIKVTEKNVSLDDGISTFKTLKAVQQTSGKIAAIQGDSGGTVFTTDGSGVDADGMIQAVSGSLMTGSDCGPVHDVGPSKDLNQCSRTVLFTPESHILSNLGATLVTG